MMTGIVFDGDQPRITSFGPMIVALTLRTSEVQIIDTWVSLGMRGTDSNDVSADGVFVPEARTFVVAPVYEPGPHFTGPLYRLPALVVSDVIIAPVALAIARGSIAALRELADRKTPLGSMKTIRHKSVVQSALADAEGSLRAARLFFYETLNTTWQRALRNKSATLEHRADLMLACTHAVRTSAHMADLMHRMGGTSGIYERSKLERHFRDAQTVRHHGFLSESRLETVAKSIWDSSRSLGSWHFERADPLSVAETFIAVDWRRACDFGQGCSPASAFLSIFATTWTSGSTTSAIWYWTADPRTIATSLAESL